MRPLSESPESRLRGLLRRPRVRVFSDFDGTIAKQDMIGAIMMHFVPTQAAPIIAAVKAGARTVQDGVAALFALLPSRRLPEVRQFAALHTELRAGFAEFAQDCKAHGASLTVISGGLDFFVQPALAPFADLLDGVYCNRLDEAGPTLAVAWPHPCDAACAGGCGLCKPAIVRQTQVGTEDAVIVIGDGVTDVRVAALADFVFARDGLLAACRQHGWPHAAFDDFHDIRAMFQRARAVD